MYKRLWAAQFKHLDFENYHYMYTTVHNRSLNTELHDHVFYEIVFLQSGGVSHLVNGHMDRITSGSLVFLAPYDTHQFSNQTPEIDLFSVSITASEIDTFLDAYGMPDMKRHGGEPKLIQLTESEQQDLTVQIQRIMFLGPEKKRVRLRILTGSILQIFLAHTIEGTDSVWFQDILLRMKSISNAAEGVPAMLRLSYLSHSQLCRLTKKHLGITPQQYVRKLRLNLAYDMVLHSDEDFQSIAAMVGYASFSHFCSSFKEWFGLSPSVLRKQSCQYSV